MALQNGDQTLLYRIFKRIAMMKNLSLIPEKFEDEKMTFLKGTFSFNSGFSSQLSVKNYEFWLKNETSRYFLGKSFSSFSADPHHKVRKATCLGNSTLLTYAHSLSKTSLKDLSKCSYSLMPQDTPLKWQQRHASKWNQLQEIKHGNFQENG